MRIVLLCPSPYSESSCATAVLLSRLGYVPTGALTLPSVERRTLIRKIAQWGVRDVARYAQSKIISRSRMENQLHNPYLQGLLSHGTSIFRNLHEVGSKYGFPVVICKAQNGPDSIAQLSEWSPDLMVFTGGDILRGQLLRIPRLGVINLHLGLLPEIRGMSSPEWSLLTDVPAGVTVHYIDAGIDTGPVLRRCEFPDMANCNSLDDLRNQLIAFGIEKIAEVIAAFGRGTISARAQSELNHDNQYFVIHERLKLLAAQRLQHCQNAAAAVRAHG
ncbi:MAG TPA: formyltransferase family protein [Candidatus Aquilonibacter sp.]|nr:formyltransferase family protein [Candidatus Aquilonibacter sp.]